MLCLLPALASCGKILGQNHFAEPKSTCFDLSSSKICCTCARGFALRMLHHKMGKQLRFSCSYSDWHANFRRLANDLILARYPSSMCISRKWLHKKVFTAELHNKETIVHCNSCTSVELYINLKLRLVANFIIFDMCHQILYMVLATLFFSSLGSVGEVILTLFCMCRYTGHHQSY